MKEKKIEMKDVNYKLQLGYVMDLKKPEIDRFERAEIVKEILATKKITLRELAKELNVGASTISGWLKWNTISEEEYLALKYKGMTKSDVTNMLKKTKIRDVEGMLVSNLESLNKILDKLNAHKLSVQTIMEVERVRNRLSKVIFKNEQK